MISMRLKNRTYLKVFLPLQLLASLVLFYYLLIIDSDENLIQAKFEIDRVESSNRLNISVVMIVDDLKNAHMQYDVAISSVKCYCQAQEYDLKIIEAKDYSTVCQQNDMTPRKEIPIATRQAVLNMGENGMRGTEIAMIMFLRHCIVAELLNESPWIFFIDADIAVINPQIRIEDYIDEQYDLTFYDRFANWEVAAGSYIAKSTQWTINFLKEFANYEYRLPLSFHGTDNGAIHALLLEKFYPRSTDLSKVCYKIWNQSNSFDDLFTFEACIRSIIGDNRDFGNVRIMRKGTGWVRDILLTDSEWSRERDFMLHGLKKDFMISRAHGFFTNLIYSKYTWRNPFKSRLELEQHCMPDHLEWPYNKELIVADDRINTFLSKEYYQVERRRFKYLSYVSDYF